MLSCLIIGCTNSIAYFWKLPKHNSGIPGQTTAQVEGRFQEAVVQSGLSQVMILTGANDIRVPSPDYEGIIANIQKMVAQGKAAGIEVILCELTPITCCNTQVLRLNATIRDYANFQKLVLIDYYTPMAGKDATYLKDGLHPNALGYAIIEDTLTETLDPQVGLSLLSAQLRHWYPAPHIVEQPGPWIRINQLCRTRT